MLLINKLTPDIKGKAFDPDWFLLRVRLENVEPAARKAAFNDGARQQREAAEELLATLPRFHDGHVTPRIELDVALVAIRTQPLVEWKP